MSIEVQYLFIVDIEFVPDIDIKGLTPIIEDYQSYSSEYWECLLQLIIFVDIQLRLNTNLNTDQYNSHSHS